MKFNNILTIKKLNSSFFTIFQCNISIYIFLTIPYGYSLTFSLLLMVSSKLAHSGYQSSFVQLPIIIYSLEYLCSNNN